MSAVYFWYNDQVVSIDRLVQNEDFNQSSMFKYLYCYCVDTFNDDPKGRYGMWENEGGGWLATVRWNHEALEAFPAEFRAHLLLLGVS